MMAILSWGRWVSSSRPGDPYVSPWAGPSLVQIMASRHQAIISQLSLFLFFLFFHLVGTFGPKLDIKTKLYIHQSMLPYSGHLYLGPLSRYAKLRVANAPGIPGTFSRLWLKPLVSDRRRHHGTRVTHVPWYLSGSLTRGGGETFSAFPAHGPPPILRIWYEDNDEDNVLSRDFYEQAVV